MPVLVEDWGREHRARFLRPLFCSVGAVASGATVEARRAGEWIDLRGATELDAVAWAILEINLIGTPYVKHIASPGEQPLFQLLKGTHDQA